MSNNLKFAGLVGSTGLSVNGTAGSISTTEPGAPAAATQFYAQNPVINSQFNGGAVNFSGGWTQLGFAFGWNAPKKKLFTRQMIVAQPLSSGNVFDMNQFMGGAKKEYSSAALIGGTAIIYDVTNGVPARREYAITDAMIDVWDYNPFLLPTSAGTMQANQVVAPQTDGSGKVILAIQSGWATNVQWWMGIQATENNASVATVGPMTFVSLGTITSTTGGMNGYVVNSMLTIAKALNVTQAPAISGTLAAPANVVATQIQPSVWQITCDPVAGAYGYRAVFTTTNPALLNPNNNQSITLDITDGFVIQPGKCAVLIENRIMAVTKGMLHYRMDQAAGARGLIFNKDGWCRSGIINWPNEPTTPYEWKKFDAGTDPTPDGAIRYYMRRSYKAGSGGGGDGATWLGGASDPNYVQRDTSTVYRFEFWHRALSTYNWTFTPVSQAGNLTIAIDGGGTTTTSSTVSITSTTSWQKISGTFQLQSAGGTSVGSTSFNRPDASAAMHLDIAGVLITVDGEEPLQLSADNASQFNANDIIRWQTTVNGPGVDMDDLTDKTGYAPDQGYSLESNLRESIRGSFIPHLMPQWYYSADEIQTMVAYLAGPDSDAGTVPVIAKRVAQGYVGPFTDKFPKIEVENGNEPWNVAGGYVASVGMTDSGNGTAISAGSMYGYASALQWDAMEASPYWSILAPKLERVACGWASSDFGAEAAAAIGASRVDQVVHSFYYSHDLAKNTTINTRYRDGTGYYSMSYGAEDQMASYLARVTALNSLGVAHGIYEGGPQYNGLTGQRQIDDECLTKSRCAAIGMLDAILRIAAAGGRVFTYFSYGGGNNWASRAGAPEGGGVFPAYQAMKSLNREMGAFDVRQVSAIGTPETISVTSTMGTADREKYVFYQIRSLTYPGRVAFVILNRDIDRSLLDTSDPLYNASYSPISTVSFVTTLSSATQVRKLDMTGNFMHHNRYPVGFKKNAATGAYDLADPACVALSFAWQDISLSDVSKITVNTDVTPAYGGPLIISMRGAQ